ncbi:MAG: mobile mystery protein A [Rhizomicrobium sp.]|jgi:predicted DNA-binding mobile mystery protein A
MKASIRQLDQRFAAIRPLLANARPPKGWVRAVRNTLGMTTQQLAQRIGVSQSRIPELEQAEANGNITLKSLERAAEALGCRVVYALVPERPLAEILRAQAERIADRQLAAVAHSMQLEDQAVEDKTVRNEQRNRLIEQLLLRPARLWDDA